MLTLLAIWAVFAAWCLWAVWPSRVVDLRGHAVGILRDDGSVFYGIVFKNDATTITLDREYGHAP